jgi:hypothetical protein
MSITGRTSHGVLAVPSDAAKPWTRALPFGELTQFRIPSEYGELAMIGRWSESIQVDACRLRATFSVELIYPAALLPSAAPHGAREIITGTGFDDLPLTVGFLDSSGSCKSALVVIRAANVLEVNVPTVAVSGSVG